LEEYFETAFELVLPHTFPIHIASLPVNLSHWTQHGNIASTSTSNKTNSSAITAQEKFRDTSRLTTFQVMQFRIQTLKKNIYKNGLITFLKGAEIFLVDVKAQ